MNNLPIIVQQATARVGQTRQEDVVIITVLGYSEGYAGPEVRVLADTPYGGIREMTLPATMVEVYTVWDDEAPSAEDFNDYYIA